MINQKKSRQWKQWMAGITATLTMFCVGTVYGWQTSNLPRMMADDSPIIITSEQSSWIVSLTAVGSMTGPFIGAVCADTYGRKKTLLLSSLFYMTGWLVNIFGTGVKELYISRVILGAGVGISFTTNPMFISEIADVNIRGALGTLIALNRWIGVIFTCTVGPFVTVQTHACILLMVPILFACLFIWFPETPYYLASKGRYVEATKSLIFFEGISSERKAKEEKSLIFSKEFSSEQEAKDKLEVLILKIKQQSGTQDWGSKFRQMLLPNNRKALGIIVFLIMAQSMSGSNSMTAYLGLLFQQAKIGINSDLATLIVLVVALFCSLMSTVAIEKVGRRHLLMASTLGTSFTLVVLATYLLADSNGVDITSVNWLPIVVVVLSQVTFQLGLEPIPDALIGELFPNNVMSIGSAMVTISDGACSSIVSKLYQVIGDAYGEYIAYYIFASFCLFGFLFSLILVPETMNKDHNQIQRELAKSRFSCFKKRDTA